MAKTPTPPKGKVKGGARFPRHSLAAATPWAIKLVSKTHGGPQPEDVVMAGVVEAKGPRGEIKISALKQFELIEGDKKGYAASELAKKIAHAPQEEVLPLLQVAALRPTLFKKVFDTFQGDQISLGKLRQRFAELNVHPDNADECVQKYVDTLEFAKLGTKEADDFRHLSGSDTEPLSDDDSPPAANEDSYRNDTGEDDDARKLANQNQRSNPRAAIQVNVDLDSSLDTEKLEKQLKLLKQYGVI